MQNRLLWADQTKALAIILVVFGHFAMSSHPVIVSFIYIFHVPLFFFVSGYLDKAKSFNTEFLYKNFRGLMIPYFFFSLCAIVPLLISPIIHPDTYQDEEIEHIIERAFVGILLMQDKIRPYAVFPLGPLWFLVTLFWVRTLFSLIVTTCKHRIPYICIVLLIVFVAGYYLDIKFFSLDATAMALPIYLCGYLSRIYNIIECVTSQWKSLTFFCLGLLWLLFISPMNGSVGIDGANYGNNVLLYYINAVAGSFTFVFLSKVITPKWEFLSLIGTSTLTILGTHVFIGTVFKAVSSLLLNMNTYSEPLWFDITITSVGVVLGVIIHKIFVKYMPVLLGK